MTVVLVIVRISTLAVIDINKPRFTLAQFLVDGISRISQMI